MKLLVSRPLRAAEGSDYKSTAGKSSSLVSGPFPRADSPPLTAFCQGAAQIIEITPHRLAFLNQRINLTI